VASIVRHQPEGVRDPPDQQERARDMQPDGGRAHALGQHHQDQHEGRPFGAIAVLADALQQQRIAAIAKGHLCIRADRGNPEPQDQIDRRHRQRVEGGNFENHAHSLTVEVSIPQGRLRVADFDMADETFLLAIRAGFFNRFGCRLG
jgi:hypothetical protein